MHHKIWSGRFLFRYFSLIDSDLVRFKAKEIVRDNLLSVEGLYFNEVIALLLYNQVWYLVLREQDRWLRCAISLFLFSVVHWEWPQSDAALLQIFLQELQSAKLTLLSPVISLQPQNPRKMDAFPEVSFPCCLCLCPYCIIPFPPSTTPRFLCLFSAPSCLVSL